MLIYVPPGVKFAYYVRSLLYVYSLFIGHVPFMFHSLRPALGCLKVLSEISNAHARF